MVYISNKSKVESGFAIPEGLPEGRLASAANRPEGNPECIAHYHNQIYDKILHNICVGNPTDCEKRVQ